MLSNSVYFIFLLYPSPSVAKFGSIIRVKKKYADKFCFRGLGGLQGRFWDGNLFDFYKKSNKFWPKKTTHSIAAWG